MGSKVKPEIPIVDPPEDQPFDPSLEEDLQVDEAIRYTLASYGADYPVDGLIKRMESEDIFVPPFQRSFVWTHTQASRFLESLLLGLPVPGIFLFKEPDTQKLMVVDGQQRLKTLLFFYRGIIGGREFKLQSVTRELLGATYGKLEDQDRRRLDDSIIHATVFKQDDPEDDRSSVYLIFERLNTGGTPLNAQEIRACVSRGPFIELLVQLANHTSWAQIYGKPSRRGLDQEMVLRFFALFHNGDKYQRPMKSFLNRFVQANKDLKLYPAAQLTRLFVSAVDLTARVIGYKRLRPEGRLNSALTETVLVGIAHRLARAPIKDEKEILNGFDKLVKAKGLQDWIKTGTTHLESVRGRLAAARDSFG